MWRTVDTPKKWTELESAVSLMLEDLSEVLTEILPIVISKIRRLRDVIQSQRSTATSLQIGGVTATLTCGSAYAARVASEWH